VILLVEEIYLYRIGKCLLLEDFVLGFEVYWVDMILRCPALLLPHLARFCLETRQLGSTLGSSMTGIGSLSPRSEFGNLEIAETGLNEKDLRRS
jgi:hypothetical protein